MIILQKSAQRHYNLQDSDELAIEKREGQERGEGRDLSMKERRNRGPKLKMEGIDLGRKKERRRAKLQYGLINRGVKIPRCLHPQRSPASPSLSPSPLLLPPSAAVAARPSWRRASGLCCSTSTFTHQHHIIQPPLHFVAAPGAPDQTGL